MIEATTLGLEDHGIPTAFVMIKFDGSGQGFGGYDLRGPQSMLNFVMGVQKAVGVSDWSKLKGAYCRVRRDSDRGPIVAIGHIVEDRWFNADDIHKEGK